MLQIPAVLRRPEWDLLQEVPPASHKAPSLFPTWFLFPVIPTTSLLVWTCIFLVIQQVLLMVQSMCTPPLLSTVGSKTCSPGSLVKAGLHVLHLGHEKSLWGGDGSFLLCVLLGVHLCESCVTVFYAYPAQLSSACHLHSVHVLSVVHSCDLPY